MCALAGSLGLSLVPTSHPVSSQTSSQLLLIVFRRRRSSAASRLLLAPSSSAHSSQQLRWLHVASLRCICTLFVLLGG